MIHLRGHSALITGSTKGVGRSIAEAFAQAGENVVLHGRSRNAEAAAVLATVLAWVADSVHPGLTDLTLVVQMLFAVAAVAAVVATADRQTETQLEAPARRSGHAAGNGRMS